MALRMVEIFAPRYARTDIAAVLEDVSTHGSWEEPLGEEEILVRALVRAGHAEPILDQLQRRCENTEGFRVVLLPVEATLPPIEEEEPEPAEDAEDAGDVEATKAAPQLRISKAELLEDLAPGFEPNRLFLLTVVLSAIVAAVGLLKDNVAIVVAAMVIAPLLSPNMALALATTLGDLDRVRKALVTNLIGLGVAVGFAIVLGTLYRPEHFAEIEEIVARTNVTLGDVLLALAAGSAGALAFTSGVPAGLVGVMVAVALMPPLIVAGLFVGRGELAEAGQALLLVCANVICVNLTAVTTFALQGIQPAKWWEAERARHATHVAFVLWGGALVLLVVVLWLAGPA